MKLNHMNLAVHDADAARVFFEKYFDLKPVESVRYESDRVDIGHAKMAGLQDKHGFVLVLMQSKEPYTYPKTFHIGFLQTGKALTERLYKRLSEDGFDVKPPGYYREGEFYFTTPWGFTIQVS